MSKLNQARTVPYDFRVFERDGAVWLFDNSCRTYICSSEPTIWAEPLYWVDGECDDILHDSGYFAARAIDVENCPKIELDVGMDAPEKETWDDAREEAHANHRI